MTKEIHYSNRYIAFSRDELSQKVAAKMSDKRFQHVLRVEQKALELAVQYGVELEKASIAALTHDYAKERPDDEMIEIIRTQGFDLSLIEFGNNVWHGVAGTYLVKRELGVTDTDILKAIEYHTTGNSEMSDLAKIIYVADYIEEGRDFPAVVEARKIAKENLDKAVAFETKQTLAFLIQKETKIYPKTIETYNTWVAHN